MFKQLYCFSTPDFKHDATAVLRIDCAGRLLATVREQDERVGRREEQTAEDERCSTHTAGQVQEDVGRQTVAC